MTKQMKAEIIWDAFCASTERDIYSCCLIDRAHMKYAEYKAFSRLRTKYCELFKPHIEDYDRGTWLCDEFKTDTEQQEWRMNALLLFREMILTGDV